MDLPDCRHLTARLAYAQKINSSVYVRPDLASK